MKNSYQFPSEFVWGVAAASAQIEGAAREDGKGESIWDRFSRRPGAVVGGNTPDVACDHYHRYAEDAALMQELGFPNYRLSVAWPRIYPQGRGNVNPAGLGFYDRVIDAFLERGITPWVTLFHWDLPQALEDEGGWLYRPTVDAFATYCQTVVQRFSDRVDNWFTLNEMPCFIGLGYESGIHAPGRRENARLVNQGYHHALLAHGYAVQAVREFGGPKARVGVVHNPPIPLPVTETPADIAAARADYEKANGQLLSPLFLGHYPEDFLQRAGEDAPQIEDGDMELIAQPTDFLGLNLYSGYFVREGKSGEPENLPFPKQFPQGDLSWINITPQTLYWAIRHAAESYGVKTSYITENGAAFDNEMTPDGEILDLDRREYLRNYLVGLHRAVDEGFDVRGYFQWSVMDNYEWAEGYSKRFGIVHVDYQTQKRTPKLSAHWYSRVIAENRII
ncbi:beta-glucosidase [Abditibacterium utsteinense]|uniref:Beta-glucosidase n=1 Tax=Abditibacterium utsteinense TaxID=1960156 RepID=A0A2S8SRW2_9BACT|nr:GH1 family beta-glucosidase [Abditibacterium utsteinense]PQV63525.1 beta-glucosidase [Abditibacterium utsteinense]